MIFVCEHCHQKRKSHKRRSKYCSHECHDAARSLLERDKLKALSRTGMTKAEIARELGVSYATVWRAIRRYGLNDEWLEMRYA